MCPRYDAPLVDEPQMTLSHHPFELMIPANAADHSIGPSNARVVVTEYGDFECPNCKQAAPAVKLLLHRFDGRIRFVYRHFPLEEVHPHALHAAEAAECAGAQGKFWPMHDLLFDNQLHLRLPQLQGYAERLELDLPRFAFEMKDQVYLQRIRDQMHGARESGVRATPTFFVNRQVRDVSFGLGSLFGAVESALRT